MQNIQVLSAGSNLQKDSEGKPQQVPVVNLMVTPEQAESLSLASNQTHIQLVLRNPVDTHLATPPGTAMAQLFGVPPASLQRVDRPPAPKPAVPGFIPPSEPAVKPPTPPEPPARTAQAGVRVVEVLNGTTRTEAQFELKGEGP
jgi:pilus assembly protein CpaB